MTAPTPQPDAERVQGEVTAAVRRGAEDLRSLYLTDQTEPVSRYHEEATTVLAAALDVEEMARVLRAHRINARKTFFPRVVCSCGWVGESGDHETHIAAALHVALLGSVQ